MHCEQNDKICEYCNSLTRKITKYKKYTNFITLCLKDKSYKEPEGLTVLATTTEDNVIDPVCVVLHGLDVRLLLVLAVPDANDRVPAS